ncbi:MAG TPA: hypothetical protein PLL66_06760 [Bacteroidales bacterium]|nr:hypothetical protein [Bacteroidales bacterium]
MERLNGIWKSEETGDLISFLKKSGELFYYEDKYTVKLKNRSFVRVNVWPNNNFDLTVTIKTDTEHLEEVKLAAHITDRNYLFINDKLFTRSSDDLGVLNRENEFVSRYAEKY